MAEIIYEAAPNDNPVFNIQHFTNGKWEWVTGWDAETPYTYNGSNAESDAFEEARATARKGTPARVIRRNPADEFDPSLPVYKALDSYPFVHPNGIRYHDQEAHFNEEPPADFNPRSEYEQQWIGYRRYREVAPTPEPKLPLDPLPWVCRHGDRADIKDIDGCLTTFEPRGERGYSTDAADYA